MAHNEKYISWVIFHHNLLLITTILLCLALMFTFAVAAGNINGVDETIIFDEPVNVQNDAVVVAEYAAQVEITPRRQIDLFNKTANNEFFAKMLELETNEDIDLECWFLGYKQMTEEFKGYIDFPETVYETFSEDEIYLIQRAVETEVYQCDFDSKVNVASVIFNRIEDGRFGSTVKEIITNPGQFAYHRTKISDSTVLAVEFAFTIGDTTDGCIAFRSDRKPDKWGKWVYRFSDSAIHHFYSEENYGESN